MLKTRLLFSLVFISSVSFAQRVYWASDVLDFSSELSAYEYSAEQVIGKPNAMPPIIALNAMWDGTENRLISHAHEIQEIPSITGNSIRTAHVWPESGESTETRSMPSKNPALNTNAK